MLFRQNMSIKRFLHSCLPALPIVAVIAGLYWQMTRTSHVSVGWLLFLAYMLIVGFWWKDIFESRFFGHLSGVVGKVYGVTAAFLLLGLMSSFFVVWYKLTPGTIAVSYGITAFVSYVFWHVYAGKYPASQAQHTPDHVYFPGKSVFIFAYILLFIAGMFFYTVNISVVAHETPWHILGNPIWIIFFFLSTFIGIFIFSKIKSSIVLSLILLFSLYTHVYLPASHTLPWGGDVWRLISVEEKLLQGKSELPVLFGPERTTRIIGEYTIADALVVPHKYTYGHLWGISVIIAKTLSIDLITLNKWLIPLVWSFAIPVIFYRTGTVLFDSRRKGLLFAWSSCLVFTLQAVGALTLPVSLGTLTFFFAMSVLIESTKQKKRSMWAFLILLSILMFFGYILHAILFLLSLIATGIFLFLQQKNNWRVTIHRSIYGAGLILALLCIPAIELVTKSGIWPEVFEIKKQLLQMIGQLSGWFYVTMIRPHDIVSGNILFNHTPQTAFITRAVTVWRYHILALSLLIWIFATYGFLRIFLLKKYSPWHIIGVLSATVIGGYIIGWYALMGDRLFTRRLDPLMAYVLLLLALYGICAGISNIAARSSLSLRTKRAFLLCSILVCSWFGTTAWLSGPDLPVTDQSALVAARFIAQDIQVNTQEPICVLADTWVLLPLEGITAGRVVGGGFPIGYQFDQKERVALYKEFQAEPSILIAEKISAVVSARSCYLVLETENTELNNELGTPIFVEPNRNVAIWKIDLKKQGE